MRGRMAVPLDILGCIGSVTARRLAQGKRHPAWSLPYEIGVEVCGLQMLLERNIGPGGRRPASPMPIPPALRPRLSLEHTTLAGLPAERHTPTGWQAGQHELLYLHGGGYFAGSPGTHRALIARLAVTSGARCVAPEYRKAPEHPFPAAIDDCVAAYRTLLDDGVEPTRLFIGGDSAGGGLTLAVLQRLRDAGEPLPRAALLLSPFVDAVSEGGSLEDNARYDYLPGLEQRTQILDWYLAGADAADPLVSAVHADLSGLPPMLVLSGELEILLDQNRAFVERARAHGVDVTHVVEDAQVHVYPLLADVSKPARRSFHQMAAFLRAHG